MPPAGLRQRPYAEPRSLFRSKKGHTVVSLMIGLIERGEPDFISHL